MKPNLIFTPDLGQGGYVKLDSINTHYHLAGEGQPVVFIHGSGPGVSAWANWRFALPALQDRFTVAALDVVGLGYTDQLINFDIKEAGKSHLYTKI